MLDVDTSQGEARKKKERQQRRKKEVKEERKEERKKRRRHKEKIWKVLGSATEWVGRGSIGWAGAVSAVPLPKSDFQHIKKVF